jgi:hypothetical protein
MCVFMFVMSRNNEYSVNIIYYAAVARMHDLVSILLILNGEPMFKMTPSHLNTLLALESDTPDPTPNPLTSKYSIWLA